MTKAGRAVTVLGMVLLLLAGSRARAEGTLSNRDFVLRIVPAGIAGLSDARDAGGFDLLRPGTVLGRVRIRYRMGDTAWQDLDTAALSERLAVNLAAGRTGPQHVVVYNGSGWYDYFADLEISERFRLEDDGLTWTIHLRNVTDKPLEISAFEVPLPFDTEGAPDGAGRLRAEARFSGPARSVRWSRTDGKGRALVLSSLAVCPLYEPAQFERNFETAVFEAVRTESGALILRLSSTGGAYGSPSTAAPAPPRPKTGLRLTPKFTPGDELTYALRFAWAEPD